jgi:hypothetical protein
VPAQGRRRRWYRIIAWGNRIEGAFPDDLFFDPQQDAEKALQAVLIRRGVIPVSQVQAT